MATSNNQASGRGNRLNGLPTGNGTVSLVAFFAALVSAVAVVLPRRIPYQQDHLTAMHRAYQRLLAHKSGWLRGALLLFVVGTAALGGVVVLVLWQG
jgi:hypothetical protein